MSQAQEIPLSIRELDEAWERFSKNGPKENFKLHFPKLGYHLTRRKKFKDAATERSFREKHNRLMTVIGLGVPDRVPVFGGTNLYPAYYSGISFADYVMDRKKCGEAFLKFVRGNTWFDTVFLSSMLNIGKLVSISGLDFFKLPGLHIDSNVSYQFVDKERLFPEEYPQFLEGGSGYFMKEIMPRITTLYDAEKGVDKKTLLKLTMEALSFGRFYLQMLNTVEREYGVPVEVPALFPAPYDLLSLFFRGLSGISSDLFRYPEMVEKTADMLVSAAVLTYENSALATGLRVALILGAPFSLSPKQFARFYMPSLKKVVEAVVERGMIPLITLEGDCTHLFEFWLELPAGKCVCFVDSGDIFKAKKILEGHMCVAGNVPLDLMVTGSPKDIREYCKRLIDEVAPGGGFILSTAVGIPDNAKPENVNAMVEYALEHGKY